jgi:hypothetical protein
MSIAGSCCTVRNQEISPAADSSSPTGAGHHAGLDEDLRQILPLDFAIDEQAHDRRIQHRDDRGFCWGGDAAQNAAEDDGRHAQGHQRTADDRAEFAQPGAW